MRSNVSWRPLRPSCDENSAITCAHAPIQILTNNLLYDFSQVPIPTDDVDPELVARPRPWSMSDLTRFILFIGPCGTRRRAAVSPCPRSR
jgi:hypothetical protein